MSTTDTIEPAEAAKALSAGEIEMIDVREIDEHAHERLRGAALMPLGTIEASQCGPLTGKRVVVHCRSGARSAQAAERMRALGVNAVSMRGGIDAWKRAGLPVDRTAGVPMPIMRQVQVVVGVGLLVGSALTWWVSPAFLIVPAFFGAGLLFAGVTGTCALASLLGLMPWNRVTAEPGGPSCPVR